MSEYACLDLPLQVLLWAFGELLAPEPGLGFVPESVGGVHVLCTGAGKVCPHDLDVTPHSAYHELGEDAESGRVLPRGADRTAPAWADQDELPPHQIRACAGCTRCQALGGAAERPAA